jgi:hypothetical protein
VKPQPYVCKRCGQSGNVRPGFKLAEFEGLEAVFVDDQPVPVPQKLVCMNCGNSTAVPRSSIEVRKK